MQPLDRRTFLTLLGASAASLALPALPEEALSLTDAFAGLSLDGAELIVKQGHVLSEIAREPARVIGWKFRHNGLTYGNWFELTDDPWTRPLAKEIIALVQARIDKDKALLDARG